MKLNKKKKIMVAMGLMSLLFCLGLAGCKLPWDKDDEPSTSSGGGSTGDSSTSTFPYAGNWTLFHTPASGTCDSAAIGTESSGSAITVSSDGIWSSTQAGLAGSIGSSGSVSFTITDSNCGNGSASGTCSSTTACNGNYSQVGSAGTWRMTR